jgi:N-acyl-D-aspartate/D-glutamate deacylase
VDLVISGGRVIDGTGTPAFEADVVIDGGRVVHVGSVGADVKVGRRIDARGLVVTPGFVDMHGHADALGANKNLLAMGVTTVILGQDGRSPVAGPIAGWIRRMQRSHPAVNVATLVGHATLRGLAHVVGERPSDAALTRMVRLLGGELDAGAFGLSTALEYQPGAQARQQELDALAKPVAARDGVIMSHLRSEDDDRIDAALDELVSQGRQRARVHVAHLKVVSGKGRARAEALLAKMSAARASGIELTADLYPYNASYTTVAILFPPFAKPPQSFARARVRRRDELAEFLRNKVVSRGGPEATLFGPGPYANKTLAEVARAKHKPFEDVLIDDVGPGGMSAAFFVMDDALQERLLADPWVMVGTDGGEHSSHPRGHGTFARVIAEYVCKRGTLTLVEAVRKMTGLAARTLRLEARGTLQPGSWADVLAFDPAEVQDHATYAEPHRRSTGMRWVLVNGQPAVADGRWTGMRGGKLLRPAASTSQGGP